MVSSYTPETKTMSDDKTWTRGNASMNWWSVQNWCKAQNLSPVSRSDIGCGNAPAVTYGTYSSTYNALRETWKESRTYWLDFYSSAYSYTTNPSNAYISYGGWANHYYPLCK